MVSLSPNSTVPGARGQQAAPHMRGEEVAWGRGGGHRIKDAVGFKVGEAEPRGRLWVLTEPTPWLCGQDLMRSPNHAPHMHRTVGAHC